MMKLPENAEYCSSCILPTDWAEVPLVSKKKYNHDSTVFTFGLPEGKSLSLVRLPRAAAARVSRGQPCTALRRHWI